MLLYLSSAEAYVEVSLQVFLAVIVCKAMINMTQRVQGGAGVGRYRWLDERLSKGLLGIDTE